MKMFTITLGYLLYFTMWFFIVSNILKIQLMTAKQEKVFTAILKIPSCWCPGAFKNILVGTCNTFLGKETLIALDLEMVVKRYTIITGSLPDPTTCSMHMHLTDY